ncbi:MAG: N-6 DNA methylase [Candidatus Methanomethyliaceae archaeon]
MPSEITEPEVAAELAAELTKYIEQGGTPFEKATVEHRAGSGKPDITIWLNYAAKQAFAFWEIKRPGLQEDLSKLPAKAQALGVRYVVVWNFQYGELYEVESGQLRPRQSYSKPLLTSLAEWSIVPKRIAVVKEAQRILDDLARLARGQSLTPFVPDKFYFINLLQDAIHRLHPSLQGHLSQAMKDRNIRSRIEAWAVKQGYSLSIGDLEALLARHWAYSLAVRVLFYFTIRRYHPGLPDLRSSDNQPLSVLLKDAFSRAQNVDWQAVFENSPLDDLGLPPDTEPILRKLLDDFHQYDFGQLKEDVIGQIMEGLIPEEERHALGQYFTREDLVDLIIGFVADNDQAFYLDPTCGSGTFLTRLYSRLRWRSGYKATHGRLLERLWGVDIAHFPAELATINLFRQDVKDLTNFPRIIVKDFFEVRPGQVFSFPPLKASGAGYPKIEVPLPQFHGIVGNFPYVRQELIERQNPGYKRKIVQAIAREWLWKDPDLFEIRGFRSKGKLEEISKQPSNTRERWLEHQIEQGRINLRLSGQADIYAYLFYHAAAFLDEGGRLGIVTSNAWLDVAYGEELKRFFLRHFKIIAIVSSWCEPWFEDAAINTAFIILERCEDPEERARNIVRFVKVKKPLSELLPRDLLWQEAERWKKVDALVREIEAAHTRVVPWDPTIGQVQLLKGVHTVETEAYRIRLVPQAELEAELEQKKETAKWGLYIRAPQVYFDLLRDAGDKLVPLSKVAEVRRGYTTGINDFFYLEPLPEPAETPGALRVRNARGWVGEIERELLRPVLLSLKEVERLSLTGEESRRVLFLCPYDRNELQQHGYVKALEYIRWGEQQRTTGQGRVGTPGVPFPKVSSVQSHRPEWFNLPLRPPGKIISNRFIGQRFGFPVNLGLVISDTFFEILPYTHEELYAAALNSTLSFLLVELTGRQTWSQGVLYLYGPELRDLLVPDMSVVPEQIRKRITAAFERLKQRSVLPITQEVRQKDRRALDEAVLEALGLDPKKYLPEIYEGLVEMVQERLALPKMRATRKKQEKRLSIDQMKEHVRKYVLTSGLKPITAFLPPGSKLETMVIPLTGRPVSWLSFLNEYTLVDAEGNEVGRLIGDEGTARYVIYASKEGQYMVEVPADPIVVEKAVQEYEYYLRKTGEQLFNRALEVTKNHSQAERIAREILESFGLPSLAVEKAMGS